MKKSLFFVCRGIFAWQRWVRLRPLRSGWIPKSMPLTVLRCTPPYFAYENESAARENVREKSANFISLNGLWKFNWVKDADLRPTNFYADDFDYSAWADMPVPRYLGSEWIRRSGLYQYGICVEQHSTGQSPRNTHSRQPRRILYPYD